MTEYVAVVQACHGNLRNDHLKEGGEGGEHAKFVGIETEACGSREVSTFHNPGGNKYFGVPLVDHLQTR